MSLKAQMQTPSIKASSMSSKRTAFTQTRSYATQQSDRFSKVEKGPEDPILGVTVAFNKNTDPRKVNLGVGAYRDDNGKPFILECVKKAEQKLYDQKLDHEYTAIGGVPAFNKVAQQLILGQDNPIHNEKRVITVQSLSGTGALRLAGAFLDRFYNKTLFYPDPTWGNHIPIFKDAGIKELKTYKYYNPKNCGLNLDGMLSDLKAAPEGSIILLHTCAHNPTGVDPTPEEWSKILEVVKQRNHLCIFDTAYQGFASGDPEKDAAPVRQFVKEGVDVLYCQSFAKNFGLYGERIGAFGVVLPNQKEAEAVESQLKILIRPMYSNPPVYGARVVSTILQDADLTSLWRKEVKVMADRIIGMRKALVEGLKKEGSNRDWSHISKQIGMFCYSGLTPEQVDKLAAEHHIYLTRNGRISIAGLSSKNVGYLAKAMHAVTTSK